MKKTLIVLSGVTQSGKTATLNRLICSLQNKFPTAIKKCLNGTPINCNDSIIKGDHRVIFDNVGINNIKIGVNTAGDDGNHVIASMKLFDEHNCDIVICATKIGIRTGAGSVSTIQSEIYERKNDIDVIPFFKLMYKKPYVENDVFMKDIIWEQLEKLIK